jgi:hypothetical protein
VQAVNRGRDHCYNHAVPLAERLRALAVSALVMAAVLWPLTWYADRDSFPLSSYPMFAHNRRSAVLTAVYAVTRDARGERRYLPPELVANREVLQARAVLDRAARGGKKGVATLCGEVAARIAAGQGGAPLSGAVEVQILRGRHDAGRYFDTGELGEEHVLGRCPVER